MYAQLVKLALCLWVVEKCYSAKEKYSKIPVLNLPGLITTEDNGTIEHSETTLNENFSEVTGIKNGNVTNNCKLAHTNINLSYMLV